MPDMPMLPPGAPPMPMGPPPGMGGGAPPAALAALGGMQDAPMGSGETEALSGAAAQIGLALARAWLRSPQAATKLSKALTLVNQAREDLEKSAEGGAMGPPPNLGQGTLPMPMGRPGGPGL